MTDDTFNLERFVRSQAGVYQDALAELAAGEKRSHWMWFIFPQVQGLGSSFTAMRYAISGLAEARSYLEHPLLGPRLVECTSLVNAASMRSLTQIFGYPDDLKFHSSVSLFSLVSEPKSVFHQALWHRFGGRLDEATTRQLGMDASTAVIE